jgi:hypothetical protein
MNRWREAHAHRRKCVRVLLRMQVPQRHHPVQRYHPVPAAPQPPPRSDH